MTITQPMTTCSPGLGPVSSKLPGGLGRLTRLRSGCPSGSVAMRPVKEMAERRFSDLDSSDKAADAADLGRKTSSNSMERERIWLPRSGLLRGNSGDEDGGQQSFSVQIVDPRTHRSAGTPGPGRGDDYYANVGKALETLKEEIPYMFEEDLTYDIYRDDIVFKDRLNSFQGLKFYKYMFLSLRCHGRVFFKKIFVDIRNIWAHEGEIRVRWTIHGVPRIPWEAEGIFDGVSTYKLDKNGKIYVHSVDNIIFRDPPVVQLPVFFNLSLNPAPVHQPCPGAWFRSMFFFQRFSMVRMYAAVISVLQVMNGAAPSRHFPC